jgi:hypothetical protein
VSRQRVNPPEPPVDSAAVKQCDGTAQDYRRHSHRGETPCDASREAWRKACRFYRYTGIYADREEDDATQQHPFMYRKPKQMHRKRKTK